MQGDTAAVWRGVGRNWWVMALRGAVALTFGILAFVWPGVRVPRLAVLFGAYVLADGLLTLLYSTLLPRGYPRFGALDFSGLISLVAGLLTFTWPHLAGATLLVLISGWAIATGLLDMGTAIGLRRRMQHQWLLGLAGFISFIFGFTVQTQPATGSPVLAWWVGGFAIVFGLLLLWLAFRLRHLVEQP